jgi:hypothetical protein
MGAFVFGYPSEFKIIMEPSSNTVTVWIQRKWGQCKYKGNIDIVEIL